MARILVADDSELLVQQIRAEFEQYGEVVVCKTSDTLLTMMTEYKPDIFLYDAKMIGASIASIEQLLQAMNLFPKIIVFCYGMDHFCDAPLFRDRVTVVLTKPCSNALVIQCIRKLMDQVLEEGMDNWCLENELDNLLFILGFRMGPQRYRYVFEAVLYRYKNPDSSMKELYIDVAKVCDSSGQRVEKSIRDGIEDAYRGSDGLSWTIFFRPYLNREKPYPCNEDFVARIAGTLRQATRVQVQKQRKRAAVKIKE